MNTCTIVIGTGKYEHALANTNVYAVSLCVIGYCGPNVLKRRNEQEVQSLLDGYRWNVTQTKMASLGKRMKPTVCITAQYKSDDHDGFQSQRGCRKHVNTKHSWFFYFDESPIRKKSILQWRTQFKIKQVKPQSMPLSYFPRFHHRVISAKY